MFYKSIFPLGNDGDLMIVDLIDSHIMLLQTT